MGGKPTPGLGFGLGMERLMLVLQAQGIELPGDPPCEVFIASMGKEASCRAFVLAEQLHRCGVAASCEVCGRSLKAQMKYANKIGAAFTLVLGEEELAAGKAKIKNMKTGEQKSISLGDDFLDDYVTINTEAADLGELTF